MSGGLVLFRSACVLVFAYAAACASVSAMYLGFTGAGLGGLARAFVTGTLIAAATALPGYVVLRLSLYATGSRQLWRFALAGALNGLIALGIFAARPVFDWYFVGMGLVAGSVYWWVERWLREAMRTE
ncbi:MAG: hypothetical protein ACKVPY_12665 [Paracoccaceae bacterium]